MTAIGSMIYSSWLIDSVGSCLGIFFNLLLLYIIFKVNDGGVQVYARMLIATAVYDLLFCLVEIVTQHQIILTDGIFYFFPRGIEKNFGFSYVRPFLSAHIFLVTVEMLVIPVQFHYKFKLLTSPATAAKPLVTNLVAGAALAMFCSQLAVHSVTVTLQNQSADYYRGKVSPVWFTEGNQTYFYALDTQNTFTLAYMSLAGALTMGTWLVSVFYMKKIFGFAATSSGDLSQKTRDLQKQFNRVLLIQAGNGFLFSFLPISLCTNCTLMHVRVETMGLFVMLPLSWLPVMNSFVTILVVRSFRTYALRMFGLAAEDRPLASKVSTTNLSL